MQLWAAQGPYSAPMGNISCYKGTDLSSDASLTHLSHQRHIKACCFLLLELLACVVFRQVQERRTVKGCFHLFFTLCLFLPEGETKQCKEWLLSLGGRQRAEYYS